MTGSTAVHPPHPSSHTIGKGHPPTGGSASRSAHGRARPPGFSNITMAVMRLNLPGNEKLVLVSLAACVNWRTWMGKVSPERMEAMTSFSESTVRRALVALEADGLISRERGKGRQCTVYVLHTDAIEGRQEDWSQQEWRETFLDDSQGLEAAGVDQRPGSRVELKTAAARSASDGPVSQTGAQSDIVERVKRLERLVEACVVTMTGQSDHAQGVGTGMRCHSDTPASILIDPIDQEREGSRGSVDLCFTVPYQRENARSGQPDRSMAFSMKPEERQGSHSPVHPTPEPNQSDRLSTDEAKAKAKPEPVQGTATHTSASNSFLHGQKDASSVSRRGSVPPLAPAAPAAAHGPGPTGPASVAESRLLQLMGLCVGKDGQPVVNMPDLYSGVLKWWHGEFASVCARVRVPAAVVVERAFQNAHRSSLQGAPPESPTLPLMKALHELGGLAVMECMGGTRHRDSTSASPATSPQQLLFPSQSQSVDPSSRAPVPRRHPEAPESLYLSMLRRFAATNGRTFGEPEIEALRVRLAAKGIRLDDGEEGMTHHHTS